MVMTMCDNTTTMSSCIISQNDFLVFFNIEDKDIKTFDIHHQKDGIYIDVTLKKKPHQCLLNAKLNKKKNKENSQNKRKSLIKVNE